MSQRSFFSKVLSGSLLIAGTTIGAGMLGIPFVTAQAGFLPAAIMTTIVWVFMVLTGILLLEVTFWMKERASFLSIAEKFLGNSGKIFTGILFVFLYFSLMIAYFAAGVPLFSDFIQALLSVRLSGFSAYILFAAIFGAIVAIGPKSIDRANLILTLLMCLFLIGVLLIGGRYVESGLLKTRNVLSIWWATPILFGAFGYHNIVPSLSTYFHHDKKVLYYSIFIGTLIPFIVYLFWQWLILGAVGQIKIMEAAEQGLSVTYALKTITKNPYVLILGQCFAFTAIVTSILGVSFSLVDFLADGLKKKPVGLLRVALTILIFAIPMFLSYWDPMIFEKALGLAGGYGEAFLNGLLPIGVYAIGRYVLKLNHQVMEFKKSDLLLLALFSLIVIGIESAHLFLK